MANETRLSQAQIRQFLSEHPGWSYEHGELRRTFELPNFRSAMDFVGRVAEVAERNDHHPDIDIRYKRVTLHLTTHSADGVTQKDPAVALECEGVLEGMRQTTL